MAESSTSMNIDNALIQRQEQADATNYEIQFDDSSKGKKWKKSIEETLEEREDRISALPDSILHHILSLLCRSSKSSTRESIKTSVLSKRWRHVWTSVPTLIFKEKYFRDNEDDDLGSIGDRTIVLRGYNKLKLFEIRTSSYYDRFQFHFDRWIHYAVLCKVEELIINCWPLDDDDDPYKVPEHLFRNSFLKELSFRYCSLRPIGEVNWANLKRLSIASYSITENLISNILSGSPSLEILTLSNCYGFDLLNITSTSLRKLVLWGYGERDAEVCVETVTINAPSILSLDIEGVLSISKFMLLNVPSVIEATLDYRKHGYNDFNRGYDTDKRMFKRFVQSLQHVNQLNIGILCYEVLMALELDGWNSPITMCKCLQVNLMGRGAAAKFLFLDDDTYFCGESYITCPTTSFHRGQNRLETMKITYDADWDSELIQIMLLHARVLEKIVISAIPEFGTEAELMQVAIRFLSVPRVSKEILQLVFERR